MILNNIKSGQKYRGFTIVELLVVIVVIGVLAAITVVSYTGITTKAKGAAAQTNANSIQQVAESYNAEAGYYPPTIAAFAAGFGSSPSSVKPASITILAGPAGAGNVAGTPLNLTNANGDKNITWSCVANCTNAQGGRIGYRDYTGAGSTVYIYVGTGDAAAGTTYVSAA